jgi:poly-gamma-glutamate synthesis protein (capsule biosynthesis protein)
MQPIDWETGAWQRLEGVSPAAEIIIAGDWAPIRDYSDPIRTQPEAVYGDLLPVLRESDIRMVNLECPLADRGRPAVKSGAVLKGLPAHVAGLTAVPFEIVTLGNNHVFDYGIEAFTDTRNRLLQNGIRFTGAGLSLAEAQKPAIVSLNGVRLGVISFGEGEDLTAATPGAPGVLGWEIEWIVEKVQRLRSEVHVVVVVCHGGVEYIPFPPPYLAETLRRIADAGADLIIGHHPHVPQGIVIHKGVPICFSLGNFVFFQPTKLLYRKTGYLVKAGVTERGLAGIRMIPYAIGPDRLRRLGKEERKKALGVLEGLSAPLSRMAGVTDAWHGFLKYYGIHGFKAEMAAILKELETAPPKGAAMFRNRLTTLQHSRHLIELMTRIMEGSLDDAPDWAVTWVADYFSRNIADGFPG